MLYWGNLSREELDERIYSVIYNRSSKASALNDIVDFIGDRKGFHKTNGIWVPVVEDAIQRQAYKDSETGELNLRHTGEHYFQHSAIVALNIQARFGKSKTQLAKAIHHDNPEESEEYKKSKGEYAEKFDSYQGMPLEDKDLISGDLILYANRAKKFKDRYIQEMGNRIKSLERKFNAGIDVGSFRRGTVRLTKDHSDFYGVYVDKLFAKEPYVIDAEYTLLDALENGGIKLWDRNHNMSTVPREDYPGQEKRFSTAQRLKEACKCVWVINGSRDFIKNYSLKLTDSTDLILFNNFSEEELNEVSKKETESDKKFLKETIVREINPAVVNIIDILSKMYETAKGSKELRDLADADVLAAEPYRVFDGTLSRWMSWITNEYRYGLTKPGEIVLKPAQKEWMKKNLGIDNDNHMMLAQEYMDATLFVSLFKWLHDNPTKTIKGL